MPNIKTGICVFDIHHPNHDKGLWENIVKVVKELKPDYFVFGGDNMDMVSVSHWLHDKGDRRHLEGKRLKSEYDTFQTEILDRLNLPKHCRKIFLLGNHESWLEKYIDKCPELEGFAEIDKCLKLKDWEIYKYHQIAKIGKIYFTHGDYTTKYTASKTLEVFGRNIVVGHGHTFEVHTKITPIDCEAHTCIEMPCACDKNPEYMRDKPSAWVNGFGVFYFHPNGNFNIYPIISSKGHFVFEGRYY
jgi:hypothetical protein